MQLNKDIKSKIFHGISFSLIWMPVLVLTFVSQRQFVNKNVLLPIARTAGYSDDRELQLFDYFSLFQTTTLEFFIILPILTVLICCVIKPRISALVLTPMAMILLAVSFINLLTVANTGNLISFEFMYSSVEWGMDNPNTITDYVSASSFTKFLVLFFAIIIIVSLSLYSRGLILKLFRFSALAYFVATVLIFMVIAIGASQASIDDFNPKKSFLVAQFEGLINKEIVLAEVDPFADQTDEAFEEFLVRTKSKPLQNQNRLVGSDEKSNNVIFFIFESGPLAAFSKARDEYPFEHLEQLKKRSFYSENHYSTYPYTSDGMFSILTSLYPDRIRRPVASGKYSFGNRGLLNTLSEQQYFTGVYSIAELSSENDKEMFEVLGGQKQYFSVYEKNAESLLHKSSALLNDIDYSKFKEDVQGLFKRTYELDLIALETMMIDIDNSIDQGQRFATVFLPQLGHGQWMDVVSEGDFLDDGAALYAMQDKWIGYIIDRLEKRGVLDDTIIVMTSDHGLRTKTEYPAMPSAFIDDYTFKVPLVIYAPKVLDETYNIESVTSHVDVMPTIFSLLDVNWDDRCMVGSLIWDDNLEDRTVYFNGKAYFGNTGYVEEGKFVSYNYVQEQFFQNDDLNFDQENLVTQGLDELRYKVEFQQAFQQKLRDLIEEERFCITE